MFKNMFGDGGASGVTQVLVSLLVVLVLAALIIFLIRYLSNSQLGQKMARGRQPRLSIVEATNMDGRRKLVIIRRDHVEHLIMIGGPNDVLIETGFQRTQNLAPQAPITQPDDKPTERALALPVRPSIRPPAAPATPVQAPAAQRDSPMPAAQRDSPTPAAQRDSSMPAAQKPIIPPPNNPAPRPAPPIAASSGAPTYTPPAPLADPLETEMAKLMGRMPTGSNMPTGQKP